MRCQGNGGVAVVCVSGCGAVKKLLLACRRGGWGIESSLCLDGQEANKKQCELQQHLPGLDHCLAETLLTASGTATSMVALDPTR